MSRFWDGDGDNERPPHWWEIDLQRALTSGRGQRFLKEIEAALLAMPKHELAEGYIVEPMDFDEGIIGNVCAVGAYAAYRQVQQGKTWNQAFSDLAEKWGGEQDDHWNTQQLGRSLGLTRTVAYELAWQNDEQFGDLPPDERWREMLRWVRSKIRQGNDQSSSTTRTPISRPG